MRIDHLGYQQTPPRHSGGRGRETLTSCRSKPNTRSITLQPLLLATSSSLGHDFLLYDLVGNPPPPEISGHRIANKHLGLALQFTETLDQVEVIGHVIGLVLPVLRFRIVGSQFDDHHLGFKRVGLLEGSLFSSRACLPFSRGSLR